MTEVSRLALYTTVYPQAARFLPSWLAGLRAQDDADFTLCVGLDSMSREQVFQAAGAEFEALWFPASGGATPAQVRNCALTALADEFDAVVLVDCDDVAGPSRVRAARRSLLEADVSCCAMRVVDEAGGDTGVVFRPQDHVRDLHRVNVLGFTNSAYRAFVLRACLPVPPGCVLMDWHVALAAQAAGARIVCDPGVHMAYRQYGANTARVLPPFSGQQVLRAARLVCEQYGLLLAPGGPEVRRDALGRELERAAAFEKALIGDGDKLAAYVEALNALNVEHAWWSCVAHPKLEDIWKS